MLLVLALMALVWFGGGAVGLPRAARSSLVGLVLIAVLALHATLPGGHPLREATGGSAAPWMLLIGFAAIWLVYARGLGWLKDRAAPPAPEKAAPAGAFSEAELGRYARHIVLREIGGPGQRRLREARVLVIGAGGLGSAALQYLAAAGVGTVGVIDDDLVENANLGRQVIHRDGDIGMPKVHSAAAAMRAQNPFVTVRPYERRFDEQSARPLLEDFDLVLDGCDNFETRYLANRVCAEAGKPLIAAALSQWEGQLSVWDVARGTPCYACIFPHEPDPELAPSCAEAGVLGPLPGIMGAMMAAEAIKVITFAGTPLRGRMAIFDALHSESRTVTLTRREGCEVCGGGQGGMASG